MASTLLLGCFYASRGMEIIKCVATHPTPDIGKTHRHLHNLYNSRDIATVGLRSTQERASAVMAQHVGDSIGQKFLLVLLKLALLPGIVHRTLALIIGILLLSESVSATPTQFSLRFKATLSTGSRELPSKAGFAPLTPQLWLCINRIFLNS